MNEKNTNTLTIGKKKRNEIVETKINGKQTKIVLNIWQKNEIHSV